MQQPDSVPPEAPETSPEEHTERILLGHITGVHGLKGWVKVHSDTSPRENIVKYPLWWLQQSSQWSSINVISGRPQGKTIIAQLEGVDTPEQAQALVGATIAIDRSAMPPSGPGEYYWADLTGMQVKTIDGLLLGPVSRLFETGANDVLVVSDERSRRDGGSEEGGSREGHIREGHSREVLVPWLVPDVITDVDMASRIITIDWDPDF